MFWAGRLHSRSQLQRGHGVLKEPHEVWFGQKEKEDIRGLCKKEQFLTGKSAGETAFGGKRSKFQLSWKEMIHSVEESEGTAKLVFGKVGSAGNCGIRHCSGGSPDRGGTEVHQARLGPWGKEGPRYV